MTSPSTAALIRGIANHQAKTHRFWRAYTRLVLDGRAPDAALELGEALQRKQRRAIIMVGRAAREQVTGVKAEVLEA